MNELFELFTHAFKKHGVLPHPLVELIAIVQPASVQKFGKCGRWEGIWPCIRKTRIPQGWPIGDGLGPRRKIKGYDMSNLQTLPCPIVQVY